MAGGLTSGAESPVAEAAAGLQLFRWRLPDPPSGDTAGLAADVDLPELAVRILVRRGIDSPDKIADFLAPSAARLHRPDRLPDIEAATDRIIGAIDTEERICVHGDYDVDGVSGTALLVSALRRLGANVCYYLPHRETEGYGLSPTGLDYCTKTGVDLLVTVDCGSADHAEIRTAIGLGIDVIVTDHHEIPGKLPPALAVVNPKRADSDYEFAPLSGSGVAFKLVWNLLSRLGRPREELTDLLDLVALGTIADVVPLVGENRILARFGLTALRRSSRPGLRALMRRAGIPDRRLSGYDISFVLGPRLNAAGRISHAGDAARLLLTDDAQEAEQLARDLDALNRERQGKEERTLQDALRLVAKQDLERQRSVVVARSGWPEGVLGIVAARLVEKYARPAIVISLRGDQGRGSARSVNGFDLYAALDSCRRFLLDFGGHRHAAGLTVPANRLEDLRAGLENYASMLPDDVFLPSISVDAVASLDEINDGVVDFIQQLEPLGAGNPAPVFASLGLELAGFPRAIGRNRNHLRLRLAGRGREIEAVAWNRGADLVRLPSGRRIDAVYVLERHSYRGQTTTRLRIKDLREHQANA